MTCSLIANSFIIVKLHCKRTFRHKLGLKVNFRNGAEHCMFYRLGSKAEDAI